MALSRLSLYILIIVITWGWMPLIAQNTAPENPDHVIYLIGDAGKLDDKQAGVNDVLSAIKWTDSKEASLVFLGDNIYPAGLSKKESDSRSHEEKILASQLDAIKSFKGDSYFIPGNHDWNDAKSDGYAFVRRQEKFIQKYYKDRKNVKFYPNNACGDIKKVKINKDAYMIFLDSEWWRQNDHINAYNTDCEIRSREAFLSKLKEIFVKHRKDNLFLMMHHPMDSYGEHGGHFCLKNHVFPLTDLHSSLFIPLPFIGSLYPMYRKVYGSNQDMTHPESKEFASIIKGMAKEVSAKLIVCSGHDHSLQHIPINDDVHQIISGSGSKESFVKRSGHDAYAEKARGYSTLLIYKDRSVWVKFYTLNEDKKTFSLSYEKQLVSSVEKLIPMTDIPSISEKNFTRVANADFKPKGFKNFWLGPNYRQMWNKEVTVPIIDIENTLGGLTPVKLGGGMSSNSLRLEAKNEKQYILRSLNKEYNRSMPAELMDLKLFDLIKQLNSAHLTYGPMALPTLSKAAGVYYTNPKLVYLQHQPALGSYNERLPEELYYFEERPSGNWSDADQFGNSEKIIGYLDLLSKLRTKKTHVVDQQQVLKSRLFDLLIHDWDRHDDQWRWASFKEGEMTVYQPIPRDRDMAFYKLQGLVPGAIARLGMPNLLPMEDQIQSVKHLSLNAQHFDRYFLNELEWEDWQSAVDDLKTNITDEVIEEALQQLPPETVDLYKDELTRKLRARRQNLEEPSQLLYNLISKEVVVHGSDDQDKYIISSNAQGQTNIKLYNRRSKKGDLLKYDRTFDANITERVRLYGLEGDDLFIVEDGYKGKLPIDIISGDGMDTILGNNSNKYEYIRIHEVKGGVIVQEDFPINYTTDLHTLRYERKSFQYDQLLSSIDIGYSPDAGIRLGVGQTTIKHEWPYQPYKNKHIVSFKTGFKSEDFRFRIRYDNILKKRAFKLFDIKNRFHLNLPTLVNIFEPGNESFRLVEDFDYHQIQLFNATGYVLLSKDWNQERLHFDIGPTIEMQKISTTADSTNSLSRPGIDLRDDYKDATFFGGLHTSINAHYTDDGVNPTNGFDFSSSFEYKFSFDQEYSFWTWQNRMDMYFLLAEKPKLIYATSVGASFQGGDVPFYMQVNIGNSTNVRGLPNARFRGSKAVYHANDLRLELFKWDNNIIPMKVGINGGFDYGRVWLDGEDSKELHKTYTVGMWMDWFYMIKIHPYYSITNDGNNAFYFRVGWKF